MSSAWSIIAKVAAFFAVVLVLSLGLCGVALSSQSNGGNLTTVALVGMAAGAVGLLLTGAAAIVVALIGAFNPKTPPPPLPPPPTSPPLT